MAKAFTVFLGCFSVMSVVVLGQDATQAQDEPVLDSNVTRLPDVLKRQGALDVIRRGFSQLDEGSLDVLELFVDDANASTFTMAMTGDIYLQSFIGKKNITAGLQEWYDLRGKVLAPTKYDVVGFAYPYAWVRGVFKFERTGAMAFDQVIVFKGPKILSVSRMFDVSKIGYLQPEYQSYQDAIAKFFKALDTGDVTPLKPLFPKECVVTLALQTVPGEDNKSCSVDNIQELETVFRTIQLTLPLDRTTFKIRKDNFPYVTVQGMSYKKGSSKPLAIINGAFTFLREAHEYVKIQAVFLSLNWTPEAMKDF